MTAKRLLISDLHGPQLPAVIPLIVSYLPEDAVVVVALNAHGISHMTAVIPATGTAEESAHMAAQVLDALSRSHGRVAHVAVVGYQTNANVDAPGLASYVAFGLMAAGIAFTGPVMIYGSQIDGSAHYACQCGCRSAGAAPSVDAMPAPVRAYAHQRQHLVDQLMPSDRAARITELLATTAPASTEAVLDGLTRADHSDRQLAAILLGLRNAVTLAYACFGYDNVVDDLATLAPSRTRLNRIRLDTLVSLAPHAPAEVAVPLLDAIAWCAYASGNGAIAGEALRRIPADAFDPFAERILDALTSNEDPRTWIPD